MTEVLAAVSGNPFLLAIVVLVIAAVWLIEKVGGVNGPLTRLWTAWTNRELNRLRREALVRAERRKLAQQETASELGGLQDRLAELEENARWQRDRDRARAEYDQRALRWSYDLFTRAQAAGLAVEPPPEPPYLPQIEDPRESARAASPPG